MQARHRIHIVAFLLAMFAGSALAVPGGMAQLTAPVDAPDNPYEGWTRVKVYYGVDGSNDYRWGWAPPAMETDSDVWAAWGGTLPVNLMDQQAAATGTHQYAIGGYSGQPAVGMYRNDLSSRTWTTMAAMPLSLCNSSACWVGDTIFVFGGYSYANNLCMDTVAKYSIAGDNWVMASGPYPGGGGGAGFGWQPNAVASGNKAYRMGGCQAPGATNPTNTTYQYTPGSGWTQLGNMAQGRVFSHAWFHADTVWMTTGFGTGNQTITRVSEFMDVNVGTWATNQSIFPDFPSDNNNGIWAGGGGFCAPGTGVGVVYSGANAAFALSSWIYEFSHEDYAWRTRLPLPSGATARYRGVGAGNAFLEAVYYGGSSGGFTPTNTVYYKTFPALIYEDDVGVIDILVPAGAKLDRGVTLTPTIVVTNHGTMPQVDVPIHFDIYEPGASEPFYNDWNLYDIAVGETLEVQFMDWQLPDEMWRSFEIHTYTALYGDLRPGNDFMRRTCIITTDTIYSNASAGLPNVDGFMAPGEWADAYFVDATNAAGAGGQGPLGPAYVWFKHAYDAVTQKWYAYYAFAMPNALTMKVNDQVGIYIDDNGDGEWPDAGDMSEGNYWFVVNAQQQVEVQYRAWTKVGPGQPQGAPGAAAAASTFNGYLVFEGRIPFGTLPWELNFDPTYHEAGLFFFALEASNFWGWWPTDVSDEADAWNDPAYYGRYILGSPVYRDVAANAIVQPTGTKYVGNSTAVSGSVVNYGDEAEANVPVRMIISGPGATYNQVVNVDLPDNVTPVTVNFPAWTPDVAGAWTVTFRTEMVGDQDPSNDEKTGPCTVTEGSPIPPGWSEVLAQPGAPVRRGGWVAMGPAYTEGEEEIQVVYSTKGNKTQEFYYFNPNIEPNGNWVKLPDVPNQGRPLERGSRGVYDAETGLMYVVYGNNTPAFLSFNPMSHEWNTLPPVPPGASGKNPKGGGDVVCVNGFIYFIKGDRADFMRYNIAGGAWEDLPSPPAARFKRDAWLVAGEDGMVYLHQARDHGFWKYDPEAGAWTAMASGMPLPGDHGGKQRNKKAKDGSSAAIGANGNIYALKGGNTTMFYEFNMETGWLELPGMPRAGSNPKARRAGAGADIAHYGLNVFYALKGNKTAEFWRYVHPIAPTAQRPERSGAMAEETPAGQPFVKVGPNPLAGGSATLRYSLPNAGPVSVNVFDVSGRTVLSRGLTASRTGAISLDLRSLSAGIYLVKVEAEGFTGTQKLVVQR